MAEAADDRGVHVEISQSGPIPLEVSFRCEAGRMLALVGPSGAGKSTILRTIAGLYRPQRGRIICGGEVWLDTDRRLSLPPHRRRTGLVFQSYALFPHLSARANVEVGLGHLPTDARRRAADGILARMDLVGLEHRKPAGLSGGQQQRVALARALANEPRVLLLDEPLSAVDRRTRRRLQADLVELRQTLHVPILLVTHDLDEAARMADQIVVLDAGQVLQVGNTPDVLAAPASGRVREILDLDPV